ncbi:MAG: septal ring lytic transglycosylase RlpA family protein [Gallionella sp.]|nr:septal ring lytic transglycosylase RlpA family protein [Gallionella sp.]MDP1939152.1 septal ring lytic transglycosylase RlpA family protein [Gallionella sp.]
MIKRIATLASVALLLSACGTTPQRQSETRATPAPIEDRSTAQTVVKPTEGSGGYLAGDGPGENIPANLDAIPDAVPASEPLHRYANRPYVALNKTYTPQTVAGNYKQRGIASWYGKKFHGQRTSSGEKYDMYAMTAAHPTLPIPSYVRVTNVATQKSVLVRVNDRGPFLHNRVIDLSYTAAHKLGIISNGSSMVEVESVTAESNARPIARAEKVQTVALEPAAPSGASAAVTSASNVFLQLGAFSTPQAAEQFLAEMRAKLGEVGRQLSLFTQNNKTRVHIGPYASEAEARSSRADLRDKLGFMPVVSLH